MTHTSSDSVRAGLEVICDEVREIDWQSIKKNVSKITLIPAALAHKCLKEMSDKRNNRLTSFLYNVGARLFFLIQSVISAVTLPLALIASLTSFLWTLFTGKVLIEYETMTLFTMRHFIFITQSLAACVMPQKAMNLLSDYFSHRTSEDEYKKQFSKWLQLST